MPYLTNDGIRLHYVESGEGPPVVLLHGLLWSSRMFTRLRRLLPGYRTVLLDLRGHGQSDRPTDADVYSWTTLASDVVACLDHLGLDRAVVGGLSLGANVALATGMQHPKRCAGLVVEMPVLSGARDASYSVFGALASVLERGEAPLRLLSRLVRRFPVPRSVPELAAIRDVAALDPVSGAAVIRGLLRAGPLPEDPETLARLTMPTLVIGHRHDPIHVFADAADLVSRLPDARLVRASTILDFRLRPDRLARHLRRFLDDVWSEPRYAERASS